MQRRYVQVVGFYENEFINQQVLLTDAEDDIAMSLLKEKFHGAILTIMKQTSTPRAVTGKVYKIGA